MSKRANPALIGGFVVAAILLAVVGVAVLGSGKLFRRTEKFVLYFDTSVNGLNVGAPVKLKGVQIGVVTEILLRLNQEWGDPRIPVVIELERGRITTDLGVDLDVANEAYMQLLIDQGLRAQLQMQSIVTGMLFVELDFKPGTPVQLVRAEESPYQEIPTLPSALDRAQVAATELLAELEEIDLRELIVSATEAVQGVSRLVNAPEAKAAVAAIAPALENLNQTVTKLGLLVDDVDRKIGPLSDSFIATSGEAAEMLRGVKTTIASLETLIEPGAPVVHQLGAALAEISSAARAIRGLAEYLERNPSSLVRGRYAARDDESLP